MGVLLLATGSEHARPSARPPIDMSGNFSDHVSGGGGIRFLLIKFLGISGNSMHLMYFINFLIIKTFQFWEIAKKIKSGLLSEIGAVTTLLFFWGSQQISILHLDNLYI